MTTGIAVIDPQAHPFRYPLRRTEQEALLWRPDQPDRSSLHNGAIDIPVLKIDRLPGPLQHTLQGHFDKRRERARCGAGEVVDKFIMPIYRHRQGIVHQDFRYPGGVG